MLPKDLETALSLRRTKEIELFPKVNTFLHSIERNGIKSKRSYSSGLTLLQNFLKEKEQQIKYEGHYNCETILQPLFENKINVYELFDSLNRTVYGETKNTMSRKWRWLQELRQQRERDIKTEMI